MVLEPPLSFILAAIGGYLLGSVPFGLVITQLAGLGDIRAIGSGNIGATNVLRTGRKDLALLTLLLDAGKAGIALLIARALFGLEAGLIAGGAAFIGHCFPVWLRFKGGKGVATFLGTLIAADWRIGLGACLVWLIVAGLGRRSSLASLGAAAASPAIALALQEPPALVALTVVLAVLIFWLHRANIGRLLRGEEPKIGSKSAAAPPPATTPPA
jgi:glycerol-3-phosphate acyltransferase PlsY